MRILPDELTLEMENAGLISILDSVIDRGSVARTYKAIIADAPCHWTKIELKKCKLEVLTLIDDGEYLIYQGDLGVSSARFVKNPNPHLHRNVENVFISGTSLVFGVEYYMPMIDGPKEM